MSIFSATCEYKKIHGLSVKIDVYPVPGAVGKTPAVMYIHGGALMSGCRTDQSEATSLHYVRQGYAAASIDYRLAPETKLADIVSDVEDAFNWLRGKGASLFNIDPDRIAVAGSSAGGYLAQVTGTFAQKPRCIVTFSGYCDLLGSWYCKPDKFYREFYAQPGQQAVLVSKEEAFSRISDHEVTEGDHGSLYLYCRQQGLWTAMVSGHDPETERDKIAPFCPALNVTKDYPPLFFFHGDADTDVPYNQATQMDQALTQFGVEHHLVTLHGAGHMIYQTGKKEEIDNGTAEMQAFLKRQLCP